MKKYLIVIFLTAFFIPIVVIAQPVEPPIVPIDAGIGFLIAAGAIFGVKKVHDFNKKKK